MEKINIAELLKDCPIGMELDSTIVDKLYFGEVTENNMIKCYTKQYHELTSTCNSIYFHYDGSYLNHINAKCVIFPKGKTTWEGFQRPFKDGDILTYMFYNKPTIYIYRKSGGYNTSYYVAYSSENKKFYNIPTGALAENRNDLRFATEEEKQKLFDVIKENGYKWNDETKTLEKLIVPKFKVGDRITNGKYFLTISHIDDGCYYEIKKEVANRLSIKNQDDWRLDKFDIATLKPFESRVLVRYDKDNKWCGAFFSHIDKEHHSHCYKYVTTAGKSYPYCIPYKGNEYLLNTTDDCNDYYKTWE